MRSTKYIQAVLCFAAMSGVRAEQPFTAIRAEISAPPAPPTMLQKEAVLRQHAFQAPAEPLYSIGNVSAEEQLYVELINRSRMNPAAEPHIAFQHPSVQSAQAFFGFNKNLVIAEFAAIPPAPPVAINAKLGAAARRHLLDMKTTVGQSHTGSDGTTVGARVEATGYEWMLAGENIFVAAEDVYVGHYAFDIDWGNTPSGIQNPPGHRILIHEPVFREVGVAVDYGSGTVAGWKIGPQLVAQAFATEVGSTPFITGVAFYDANGNNFYDMGEGIGNVVVRVVGSPAGAITAMSGGYSLPVPGNGTYNVSFTFSNGAAVTNQVTVSKNANSKLDFKPAYNPPVMTGPAVAIIGRTNHYSIAGLNGATSYDLRRFERRPALLEGAEDGTNSVVISTTGNYQTIHSGATRSGLRGFHLAHLLGDGNTAPPSQIVTLRPTYIISTNSILEFYSKVAKATVEQVAKVQISEDGGTTWRTVYSQAGVSTGAILPGETSFVLRSVSLAPYAGKEVKIRFSFDFDFVRGSIWPSANLDSGWVFDDIHVKNADELLNESIVTLRNTSFNLEPQIETGYGFQVRARTGSIPLPFGPVTTVQTAYSPTEVRITRFAAVGINTFELEFQYLSGRPATAYTIQGREGFHSSTPWTNETAQVTSLGNNRFRVTLNKVPRSPSRFYRVEPVN